MTRFLLTLEYDGSAFCGWQRQTNGLGVQQAVEEAVAGFCGEEVEVAGAGRTDAGVHARGQCAHVDIQKDTDTRTLVNALNAHLRPHPVAIINAEIVPDDFHARFSATRRHYMYRIENRRAPLTLDRGRAWAVGHPLDVDAMNAAASHLLGRHDFTTFRAAGCQANSPIRTLDHLHVMRMGTAISITTNARSFLYSQVRAMAGSLKLVGEGKWTPDDMRRALAACDRAACGPVAPPDGLYLMAVDYAERSTSVT
ncbi:MAG TPA: tRNA pseudouridine(38-40) synthase TruA [Micropepsaceae bacterium]|nr:tRNA pseudouridine(38-40) synthase TruA [Micropepsaceae bacterium]